MGLVNFIPGKVLAIHGGSGTIEAGSLKLIAPVPAGTGVGDTVEVAIRPENIKLTTGGAASAKITERTFLGNICEYYAALDSGQTLRVQTHPTQVFSAGDAVAVEIDATQCSVFRNQSA